MLTETLHRLVARPRVYDAVQIGAGASIVRSRLTELVPSLPPRAIVVDLGAGTGLYRAIWGTEVRYLCLDLDPLKLLGFRTRHRDCVLLGDATRLPFADANIDAVASTLMAHHLTDEQLSHMLLEVARVLKPAGAFVFADPVWQPARLPGRLLWNYDRGAYPRPAATLRAAVAQHLTIQQWINFAVWHRYAAGLARKARHA